MTDNMKRAMRPFLTLLRYCGFMPSSSACGSRLRGMLPNLLPYINFAVSAGVFGYTAMIMHKIKVEFGMFDAQTMIMIIGGLKPLQCLINFITIAPRPRKQMEMWLSLGRTIRVFDGDLQIRLRFGASGGTAVLITLVICACVFCMRIIDYFIVGRYDTSEEAHSPMVYASYVIVIFLNGWAIVPLLYFHIVTKILRRLAFKLGRHINRGRPQNIEAIHASDLLPTYYDCFSSLTETTQAVDRVFNLFVLLSTLRCVTVLCLTLYFLSEFDYKKVLKQTKDYPEVDKRRLLLNIVWCAIDIVSALVYLCVISWDGAEVNRSARSVMDCVLNVDAATVEDRYQKVSSQHSWGISAWRAFPIERSYALTICSAVLTYSILMWKLRKSSGGMDICGPSCCGPLPGNATFS